MSGSSGKGYPAVSAESSYCRVPSALVLMSPRMFNLLLLLQPGTSIYISFIAYTDVTSSKETFAPGGEVFLLKSVNIFPPTRA